MLQVSRHTFKSDTSTDIMARTRVDFTPTRIDYGGEFHVISGTQGEVCILGSNGSRVGRSGTIPFPAPAVDGVVLGTRWVGIWLDREFQTSCMASLPLENSLEDGPSRESLRLSLERSTGITPANSIWSRELDSEPMKIGISGENVVFATHSGIFMIDINADLIWVSPLPSWPPIYNLRHFDAVASINEFPQGIAIWSQAGGVSVLDPSNGIELHNSVMRLKHKISNVYFSEEGGWLIVLHGNSVAELADWGANPKIHKTFGPVMDAKFLDGRWLWTGWRHDGELLNGEVKSYPREEIGVGILDGFILLNNGCWDNWGQSNLT